MGETTLTTTEVWLADTAGFPVKADAVVPKTGGYYLVLADDGAWRQVSRLKVFDSAEAVLRHSISGVESSIRWQTHRLEMLQEKLQELASA
jgi:hypothetical protein